MFTIYHIPGIKFGLTKDFKRRSKENCKYYGINQDQIQITHLMEDVNEASMWEDALNNAYNYMCNNSYIHIQKMVSMQTKGVVEKRSKTNKERNHKRSEEFKENISEMSKGRKHMKNPITKEQRFVKEQDQKELQAQGYVFGRFFDKEV